MASTASSIKDFTRAMLGDWLARMSGPLSVPAAAIALWAPSDAAKILFGLTAFICLWVTAYRVWKPEHDKVVERDQRKRQLLDDISELREKVGSYRIEMEADYHAKRFDEKKWQRKFDELENEIASKIEELSSKAEAITYRHRGNIHRAINTNMGGYLWPLLVDICAHDLDYLKTLIHDYSRGRDRTP
jgi:hypothetical protein